MSGEGQRCFERRENERYFGNRVTLRGMPLPSLLLRTWAQWRCSHLPAILLGNWLSSFIISVPALHHGGELTKRISCRA